MSCFSYEPFAEVLCCFVKYVHFPSFLYKAVSVKGKMWSDTGKKVLVTSTPLPLVQNIPRSETLPRCGNSSPN